MDNSSPKLGTCADIYWDENGQPISQTYDDIYFNKLNGLKESQYVFLKHNGLPERWNRLSKTDCFTVGETGFGTGLNFLTTLDLWQRSNARGFLHFISVEKHPLKKDDLIKALNLWPELQQLSAGLIAQYPPVDARGFHRLHFGNVCLTLIFDDAESAFQELLDTPLKGPNVAKDLSLWSPGYNQTGLVDAWYLDGFAPAKNPSMWSESLFSYLERLSRPGATVATFTCAGLVKRGLSQAGFRLEKPAGFGRKREMLRGDFIGRDAPNETQVKRNLPPSWHLMRVSEVRNTPSQVTVIGAGLAGANTARALAEKGVEVTVLDQGAVANGASGNPQGIVYSKLSHQPGVLAKFNLAAFIYALRFYQNRNFFALYGKQCGVLQLLNKRAIEHVDNIIKSFQQSPEFVRFLAQDEAAKTANIALENAALWFPSSGWLAPKKVCQDLLDHPNIQLKTESNVTRLELHSGVWQCFLDNKTVPHQSAIVVLASAHQSKRFSQTAHLPGKAIRGQVSLSTETEGSKKLTTVVCSESYIAPSEQGSHCLGASYNLHSNEQSLSWEEHQQNLNNIRPLANELETLDVKMKEHGRVSFRCSSPDYLPLVGPVPKFEQNRNLFAAYRYNFKQSIDSPGEYHPNLYVNYAHGSRGLAYTPLCAEALASLICGHPLPVSRSLMLHLHPMRFLIRDLARNKI